MRAAYKNIRPFCGQHVQALYRAPLTLATALTLVQVQSTLINSITGQGLRLSNGLLREGQGNEEQWRIGKGQAFEKVNTALAPIAALLVDMYQKVTIDEFSQE